MAALPVSSSCCATCHISDQPLSHSIRRVGRAVLHRQCAMRHIDGSARKLWSAPALRLPWHLHDGDDGQDKQGKNEGNHRRPCNRKVV